MTILATLGDILGEFHDSGYSYKDAFRLVVVDPPEGFRSSASVWWVSWKPQVPEGHSFNSKDTPHYNPWTKLSTFKPAYLSLEAVPVYDRHMLNLKLPAWGVPTLFNVIIDFGRSKQEVTVETYKDALDRAKFERERYPEAIVSIEPAF